MTALVPAISRWLEFAEASASGRTKRWDVLSKTRAAKLGEIAWYGRWRQYAFFPQPGTLFNAECLVDIADFLADHRADRRTP